MATIYEFWYVNGGAFIATMIAAAVAGYIWYDMYSRGIQDKQWLTIAGVSLVLTLPVSWNASGTFGVPHGTVNLQAIPGANLYFFLGVVGLIGSLVAGLCYYRNLGSYPPKPLDIPTFEMTTTEEYTFGGVYPTMNPTDPRTDQTSNVSQIPTMGGDLSAPALGRTRQMDQPARPAAWLVMRDGLRKNKGYPLDGQETLIGRDGQRCQIVLDHETISGQHAKVKKEQGCFWLYDLASTNGTFLNKKRIQHQRLEDDDEIRLGALTFIFKEVR